METKRKTISITGQQDIWTKSQIAASRFADESENIRDPVRRGRSITASIEEIRAALIEGELSGDPEPFNPEQFKQEIMAKGLSEYRLSLTGFPQDVISSIFGKQGWLGRECALWTFGASMRLRASGRCFDARFPMLAHCEFLQVL